LEGDGEGEGLGESKGDVEGEALIEDEREGDVTVLADGEGDASTAETVMVALSAERRALLLLISVAVMSVLSVKLMLVEPVLTGVNLIVARLPSPVFPPESVAAPTVNLILPLSTLTPDRVMGK